MDGNLLFLYNMITPKFLQDTIYYMFPIVEIQQAYDTIAMFLPKSNLYLLQHQLYNLLFITFHIQVGMGYLGIDFLRQEQKRRNELIRINEQMDDDDDEDEDEDEDTNGETKTKT